MTQRPVPADKTQRELAKRFLEVIPRTMLSIRSEVRSLASDQLTVPQLRVMAQLTSDPLTNGELAERIGVSVPAMSRLVDGLVRRGMLSRRFSIDDRRQVRLELSPAGRKAFRAVTRSAQARFSRQFANLPEAQRSVLAAGLSVLEELFR